MADPAKVAADKAAADKAAAENKAAQEQLAKDNAETKPEQLKPGETGVNQVDLGSDAARDAVLKRQEQLSRHNEEGHAKNMKAIEEKHKDNDPEHPKVDTHMGREDNANTPIIDPKTGAKSWPAPGIAGVTSVPKSQ